MDLSTYLREACAWGRRRLASLSDTVQTDDMSMSFGRGFTALIYLCAFAILFFPTGQAHSQSQVPSAVFEELPVESSSSRLARLDAIRNFPMDQLSPATQRRVQFVLAKPTLYRRIIARDLECDADLFLFLVRYPEVVVNIWEFMGVTQMQVVRTSDCKLHVDDGQGTVSSVELLYGTPNLHVVYADGVYEGPLFGRKLKAKCAFLMNTQFSTHSDGRPLVRCQLDVFVRVENLGVELLTKTLRPVAVRMADYNFSESTQFISQISKASVKNGAGIQRLAHRLHNLDPEIQAQFSRITAAVSDAQPLPPEHRMTKVVGTSSVETHRQASATSSRRTKTGRRRQARFVPRR